MRLELSPSAVLALAIVAAHLAAASCVALAFPGVAGAALALLLLALGFASAWQRALLRGPRSPRVIEVAPSGEARVIFRNAEHAPARAVGGLGTSRHCVTLQTGSRHVLLTSDMLGRAGFRLLRLWARWGRIPGMTLAPVASGQRGA